MNTAALAVTSGATLCNVLLAFGASEHDEGGWFIYHTVLASICLIFAVYFAT